MMPSDETVYAHTEPQPYERYPAYLNITRRGKDGAYVVTVRSRDTCGTGQIVLTPKQWRAFRDEVAFYEPG